MVRTLFVAGLASGTTPEELRAAFERYGKLARCDIPKKRGLPGDFAFVEYEDDRDAEDAKDRMQGTQIAGRAVAVEVR